MYDNCEIYFHSNLRSVVKFPLIPRLRVITVIPRGFQHQGPKTVCKMLASKPILNLKSGIMSRELRLTQSSILQQFES